MSSGPQKQLSELTIGDYRDAFKTFDLDEDGYLSLKEVSDLLMSLGMPVSEDELREMTNEVDIEGNGTVDFKEFIQLMARKLRDMDNEEEYIEAFKIFDKNSDDLISIDELREVMTILGQYVWNETPSDEEIVQMIKDADEDFDGYLNFSEFLKKIQMAMSITKR